MGATFSTVYDRLKEYYFGPANGAEKIFYDSTDMDPLLAACERQSVKTGGGRKMIFPITWGLGTAVNPSLSKALTKSQGTTTGSALSHDRWEVDPLFLHAAATWDLEAILRGEGAGASYYADIVDQEIQGKITKTRMRLQIAASEAGWGRAGIIIAAPTSTTVTVHSAFSNRFEVGDDLVAAATESASALRSATTRAVTGIEVDAINETCVLTLDGDPTALSWANGDVLFFDGYRENSGSPSRLVHAGVRAWAPISAPSDTFMGVVRTGNPAFSAVRMNAATQPDIATALINMANYASSKMSTQVDAIFTSSEDITTMLKDAETKKIADATAKIGPYEISYSSIGVRTSKGLIPVIACPYFEKGTAIMGPWNSPKFGPKLAFARKLINIMDDDGLKFRASATANTFTARLYTMGNIVFPAIGKYLIAYNLPT